MRARRRSIPQQTLSFLDCMSCGLGAVVLLFMIIHHASTVRASGAHREIAEQVSRLESEVLEKRGVLSSLAAALEEAREESKAASALASSLESSVANEQGPKTPSEQDAERVAALEEELRALERQVLSLREQKGDATRSFAGEGTRRYLTGLRVEGRHVLILVDASASMLGETIVDVLRRRNMSAAKRLTAPKWRRTVATVDWITTRVAPDARFQIYTFGVETRAVLDGTDGRWLETEAGSRLGAAVEALRRVVPEGGTSLERAFAAAARLSPRPDSIYLLTDGLPTQGGSGVTRGTVSGEKRLRFYQAAVEALPKGSAVHVVLFPMEGDPFAGSVFWQLAELSGGAFLSPSRDWP